MNAKNILAIVVAILIILLLWTGYRSYNLSGEVQGLSEKNEMLNSQIGDLEALKSNLETEVERLQSQYEMLSEENVSLANNVEEEKARTRRKNATIQKLKAAQAASESETNDLRSQIQALMVTKAELESNIASLQEENAELRESLGIAEADLGKAREDNAALEALNKSMQAEISKLTLSNFKASAFEVVVEKKRGEKVTAKSRLARRVKASFDLTNVPEKYQGVRPLYMVITDQTSTPIKLENPVKATVAVHGQNQEIIAAETKEVNIKANQRLTFSHDLSEKLKKGYYQVKIFTDIGLLGGSNIRLR